MQPHIETGVGVGLLDVVSSATISLTFGSDSEFIYIPGFRSNADYFLSFQYSDALFVFLVAVGLRKAYVQQLAQLSDPKIVQCFFKKIFLFYT